MSELNFKLLEKDFIQNPRFQQDELEISVLGMEKAIEIQTSIENLEASIQDLKEKVNKVRESFFLHKYYNQKEGFQQLLKIVINKNIEDFNIKAFKEEIKSGLGDNYRLECYKISLLNNTIIFGFDKSLDSQKLHKYLLNNLAKDWKIKEIEDVILTDFLKEIYKKEIPQINHFIELFKNQMTEYIGDGEIEKTLSELLIVINSNETVFKEVVSLKGFYSRIEKQRRRFELNLEEYNILLNRISNSILDVILNIEKSHLKVIYQY